MMKFNLFTSNDFTLGHFVLDTKGGAYIYVDMLILIMRIYFSHLLLLLKFLS